METIYTYFSPIDRTWTEVTKVQADRVKKVLKVVDMESDGESYTWILSNGAAVKESYTYLD